jgi:hypothetical protein
VQPLTWIQIAGTAIAIISTAAIIATLAAVGAALARNWLLFKKCGIAAVVAIAGLILTFGLLLSAIASLDPDTAGKSRAAVLARGISEGMNASLVLLALGLVVTSAWWIAKRRARKRE